MGALLVVVAAGTLGCGGPESVPGVGGATEGGGPARVPGDLVAAVGPQRIVSLMPSTTAILVELGVADRIVARTNADPDDPALAGLPSVGDPLTPSPERLSWLRPDLVVAWAGSRAREVERTLAEGGRLLLLDIQGMPDLRAAIDTLGALTGRRERADSFVRVLDADLAHARRVAAGGPPLRVAWLVWPDPPRLAGVGSFVHEVLEHAGAENVMEPGEGAWPRISLEVLLAREPDVIIWPRGGGVPGPESADRLWELVPAYREGRVLRVEADSLHVPGPWIGRATLDLARRLERMR